MATMVIINLNLNEDKTMSGECRLCSSDNSNGLDICDQCLYDRSDRYDDIDDYPLEAMDDDY